MTFTYEKSPIKQLTYKLFPSVCYEKSQSSEVHPAFKEITEKCVLFLLKAVKVPVDCFGKL